MTAVACAVAISMKHAAKYHIDRSAALEVVLGLRSMAPACTLRDMLV